ncbi:MAG: transcription antitermination factor NusB [Bacteroidales bacterium]|nr:transcription antitermination factor NusB [Bacteroidales bacterium]
MLNRRFLRVKVLQEIYAYHQAQETDVLAGERQLMNSIDALYGLFIRQLTFLVEVKCFAERRIEENLHKNFPTEEDLNPNRRFVHNRVLNALENNKDLQRLQEKYKISWVDDREDFIRGFYNRLREYPEYVAYMNSEQDSFAQDKRLLLDLIDNHIVDDELIFDYYADKNLFYYSDYQLGLFLLWKFLNEMDAHFDADTPIPPAFKTENDESNDDKRFVVRLFKETLTHAPEYQPLVASHSANWDYERVALMDKIILFMALTEFCQFPEIPVKVTINEYIEISKFYSTPESRRFINGILDKLAEQLKAEGKLVKRGRGLV